MQLVAVYEVLKDDTKRQMYNRVLVEGLPDWRTPVFYYRRARKMGFTELCILFALITTVGQYLFGWAVYVERRLTLVGASAEEVDKIQVAVPQVGRSFHL